MQRLYLIGFVLGMILKEMSFAIALSILQVDF